MTNTMNGTEELQLLDAMRKAVIARMTDGTPAHVYDACLSDYERECRAMDIDPDTWEGIRH